ncbi:unnamed protein product [marine sediment metagenome]|uniref:Uncharacterized protein n=1 Tax=marine sediment metagenome TaxID=412755 RepID=X1JST1_9ZZZZ
MLDLLFLKKPTFIICDKIIITKSIYFILLQTFWFYNYTNFKPGWVEVAAILI